MPESLLFCFLIIAYLCLLAETAKERKGKMGKNTAKRAAFEALTILAALLAFCLIIRLWPLVFLVIPGILIAALRYLFLAGKKDEPVPQPVLPAAPRRPVTEQDVIRAAFGLLQRRIAEQVTSRYPSARWLWMAPNSFERFSEGLPLYIMLNGAGGFRKAQVMFHNLRFKGLQYESLEPDRPDEPSLDDDTEEDPSPGDDDDMGHTDYGVLAFEWVEANLLRLNGLCNAAIAKGENTLLITPDTLPDRDSWEEIRLELTRNGFTEADATEDGINVTIDLF